MKEKEIQQCEESMYQESDEKSLSSDDIQKAYCFALDPTDQNWKHEIENQEERESLFQFAQTLTEAFDKNFPINRISNLIETQSLIDNGESLLESYLQSLPCSEKEKEILKKIPEKKYAGMLTIKIPKKHHISKIQIEPYQEEKIQKRYFFFYEDLKETFQAIPEIEAEPIEIYFEHTS